MNMAEFDKLEDKVNNLVKLLKHLKEENSSLKKELEGFQSGANELESERNEIRKKVKSLIHLIDSIDADGERN